MEGHFEIERRFLIRFPDPDWLRTNASGSEIRQTYLTSPAKGVSARVRARSAGGKMVYTHTVKTHVSDIRRIEVEEEISSETYQELLKTADPARRTIEKQRWLLEYEGQLFEIDLFPFWTRQALMEIELSGEAQPVSFPPEIGILREVTEDGRYTNRALAREIPPEETF